MSVDGDRSAQELARYRPVSAKTAEPWEAIAADRDRCPVAFSPDIDAFQVTSYPAVKDALRNPRVFSNRWDSATPRPEPLPVEDQVLAYTDPPRHTQQRKLLTAALSASRMEKLRPVMQRFVDDIIDGLVARGGGFEVISTLARPFPAHMTAELMGVPVDDREQFIRYSELAELETAFPGTYRDQLDEWGRYIEDLVEQRRAAGPESDDLITTMCFAQIDGQRFTAHEVSRMVMLLNSAGNTTTTTLIGNAIWLLDRYPDQKARYLSDIEGRVEPLVEETLRFDGPIHGLFRRTTEDTALAGQPVPVGQQVFACYAAANHDPAVYHDPDRFLVDRDWKQLPAHLAFGYGIHHCIGANLARVEAQVALATLYRRLPGLRVRPGFTPEQVPGLIFRGWMGLELAYDPPALPRNDT